jgi:hypothetical protein
MRSFVSLLTLACLTACGETQIEPQQTVMHLNDGSREQQVTLDVAVMMRGMEQSRERREAMARSGAVSQ